MLGMDNSLWHDLSVHTKINFCLIEIIVSGICFVEVICTTSSQMVIIYTPHMQGHGLVSHYNDQ